MLAGLGSVEVRDANDDLWPFGSMLFLLLLVIGMALAVVTACCAVTTGGVTRALTGLTAAVLVGARPSAS
jgi:hypothetical protein